MNNPTFSDNPVPVNSSQCHCLNILFWNIRGITDKLQNRHLSQYICQHDIVCLVESMLDPQKLNKRIEIKSVNECLVWIIFKTVLI